MYWQGFRDCIFICMGLMSLPNLRNMSCCDLDSTTQEAIMTDNIHRDQNQNRTQQNQGNEKRGSGSSTGASGKQSQSGAGSKSSSSGEKGWGNTGSATSWKNG